jgi:hypothetical protein
MIIGRFLLSGVTDRHLELLRSLEVQLARISWRKRERGTFRFPVRDTSAIA